MVKREFPALVAEVLDGFRVIINRGSIDNVKIGDRFLLYDLTKEIMDPETHESLGRLEVSKGQGVAIQVQEKMAVIISDSSDEDTLSRRPFNDPRRGDRVKPI
jgi:hypothetical protein